MLGRRREWCQPLNFVRPVLDILRSTDRIPPRKFATARRLGPKDDTSTVREP